MNTGNGAASHEAELGFSIERDLLCMADAEGRFTSLNAAWERLLGWSREELMSRPSIEFVHPDDVAATVEATARMTEHDHELEGFENRYRTKAGDWRWLRWSARYDGVAMIAVATDVTDAKRTEERLLAAIRESRLLAYSQPIIEPESGRVVQEELLVRMRLDGNGRVLLPAEFLPEAERAGVVGLIDRYMTLLALRLARSGRNVEVNLSARSIADQALMDELGEELQASGWSARRLIFEITETAALENLEAARELAERLGRLGCRIALDDFGTGFGSLTHLRQLPLHMLKIDASFVGGMRHSAEDRALVRGVTTLAREMRLATVAEGVEDAATYELCRQYGIDRAQGFLIGYPAPVAPVATAR